MNMNFLHTHIDDPVWTSGDITIYSGDPIPVRFCVPYYIVIAGSKVLRGMIEDQEDRTSTIEFVDDEIESAENIRAFLHVADGSPPADLLRDNGRKVFALVPFLDKYDCSKALKSLSVWLKLQFHANAASPELVFTVGAVLDQWEVCMETYMASPSSLAVQARGQSPLPGRLG